MSTIGAAPLTLVALARGLRCSGLHYLCVFTVDGWLRPGYDAASMFISELSLGPWGWVQIVNFMIFGLALLVFATSVALEFGDTRSARVGVTLLVIMGIGMLASGPFVIDPMIGAGRVVIDPVAVAPHHMSFHSKFHYALGTLFFLLAPATCFCFAGCKRSSKDPMLRVFRLWSFDWVLSPSRAWYFSSSRCFRPPRTRCCLGAVSSSARPLSRSSFGCSSSA
jgi:hypothetical protein